MTINLKVLDLSHHNVGPHDGPIDFAAIAGFGVRGIIHKASQGIANIDRMYAQRREAATAAGLLWGAYHFADSSDPLMQVQHFMDTAQPVGTTLMALDFEPNGSSTMRLEGARSFLHAIEEQLGRKAVLYSGNLIKETLGDNPDDYLDTHRLWLAHYNNHPNWPRAWDKIWLHQFSGDGVNSNGFEVPGVNRDQADKIDMNSFAGADDELAAQWAS